MKYFVISLGYLALLGCGESEPVATSYKKSVKAYSGASPANQAGSTPTPAGGSADAQATLIKQGQDLYKLKCESCHKPIASSDKKGATAKRITDSATISFHTSVMPFPTTTEAAALEAALK